ncbi:MAG: NAD(P)-dependent glycerol-3-phosphate dehydrogenase [Myxococcaceae bacterium]|jgi:glycerol-3-phosphate dehydrogenase (NAD(P)+)|nr:NAD(P)-dependent glycerol-3-phosphate dehydrogenase [Myxococcaceae bacterium]
MKKATVFGAGSFGTAIASVLTANFDEVVLWGRDAATIAAINERHENPGYLPGLTLSGKIVGRTDLEHAADGAELVAVATPSQATRDLMKKVAQFVPSHVPVVSVAKGIENETLLTMTEVLEQCLPEAYHPSIAVLSGPSFAKEMILGMPTVVTIASRWEKTAQKAQGMFSSERFRAYTSTDVVGVQVGGSLKNVIAIAAGMADGLGLGHNTRAAIITRGLAEISRIAMRMGANPLTLSGLAGMGDLVLTCTGELSRNRKVGIELGKGRSLDEILAEMKQVAEGVKTAKSAKDLSTKLSCELPICEQVYKIAYEGKSPKAAALDLMVRTPKSELT